MLKDQSKKLSVLTKADFYRRWNQGEFGNKLRTWDRVADIPPGVEVVTVRVRNPSSPMCRYGVPVRELREQNLNEEFTFNEDAPDHKLILQGEATLTHAGLNLFYSTEQTKMRIALLRGKSLSGLAAKLLLQRSCDPSSFDALYDLLHSYEDHVVEFGCYSINLGNIPRRNTVIWEVRRF